jgi:RecB family exonuclease
MWIDVLDTREDLFFKQISAENYDDEKRPIRQKFSDAQIREAIEHFKRIRQKLQDQLGEDLVFITEPAALGTLDNETKGVRHLIGRIDMVVIDKDGNAHVVDYKTSPKNYNEYNDAKKLGFSYQLAAYSRILAQNGLKFNAIRSFIAPIQLEGFRPDTEDGYTFDHIKSDLVLEELTSRIRTSESIIKNLNEVLYLYSSSC